MKIVKRDSFRSEGALVNKTDDMYRVVVDMTRGEFFAFSQWAARQENKESPENSPASPVQHAKHAGALREIAAEMDAACGGCPADLVADVHYKARIKGWARQLRALQ